MRGLLLDRILRRLVERDRHPLIGPLVSAIAIFGAVSCDPPPDPRRTNFRVERGNVAAQYDDKTGRLRRLEVDIDKNGKTDTWQYMDGTRVDRVEIDRDEDGKIDRWEYYTDNQLAKVGTSSRGDGVVDEWAYSSAAGVLERVESDTDRDGKVDKWERYATSVGGGAPILVSVEFDGDKQGVPTERLMYRPDGSLERVEKLNVAKR